MFEVDPADADESIEPGTGAEAAAVGLAERKARLVAGRRQGRAELVLGSDTIVALGDRLLGKPEGPAEARGMLEALSGSRHRVVTGVCVVDARDGRSRSGFERTWVSMRPILPGEVSAYVESGEWEGKAGGYAIQENADAFVTGLEEGGFDNVVGLPVQLCQRLLTELGGPLGS